MCLPMSGNDVSPSLKVKRHMSLRGCFVLGGVKNQRISTPLHCSSFDDHRPTSAILPHVTHGASGLQEHFSTFNASLQISHTELLHYVGDQNSIPLQYKKENASSFVLMQKGRLERTDDSLPIYVGEQISSA